MINNGGLIKKEKKKEKFNLRLFFPPRYFDIFIKEKNKRGEDNTMRNENVGKIR